MPKPRKGQSKESYMKKCVPMVMKEGKTNEQAVGQCMGMWDQHQKKISKNEESSQLEVFTVNLMGDSVHDDTLNGEEYWVAPLAMMTECVANGSNGPGFYPADELERWTLAWNHKPIVAPCHPEEGSACTKEFLDKHQIGLVMNAYWNGKQRAFGWFNKKQTRKKEKRVANALENRRMMELSTGLFVDPEYEEGTFKGEKYEWIARNHRPDHLAILPDKVGACSIAKGAGLLQLNEDMSHEQLRMKLQEECMDLHEEDMSEYPNLYQPYVREVYDSYFIYSFGGNLYKQSYTSSDGEVALVGSPEKVKQQVDYVPVENTEDEMEEEMPKSKKQLVSEVIANGAKTKFLEADRKYLEGLDEKRLEGFLKTTENAELKTFTDEEIDEEVEKKIQQRITENAAEIKEKAEAVLSKNEAEKKKSEPAANQPRQPMSMQEWLAQMPPEARAMHNQMASAFQAEQHRLISTITANRQNTFSEDQLKKMDIDTLRNMAKLAAPPAVDPSEAYAASFFTGAPGPMPYMNQSDEDDDNLELPVYNNEKFNNGASSLQK